MSAARAARAQRLRGIYAIVNDGPPGVPLARARAALDGGVRILQYRAKAHFDPAALRALVALARERDALLILNDRVEAVRAFDCDGVHLGPDDAGFHDLTAIRAALPDRLIGLSCGTPAEARAAGDADYLGVGAIYATASKSDAGAPIGIDGLRATLAATALPVAAIGGITLERLPAIRASGAAMAAVIGAIFAAADPARAARALVDRWEAPAG